MVLITCVKFIGKDNHHPSCLWAGIIWEDFKEASPLLALKGVWVGCTPQKPRLQAGMAYEGEVRLREGVVLVTSCRAGDEPISKVGQCPFFNREAA